MIRPERKHMVTGALVVTFLAQLGGHQEIHHQIANIAMGVEVATLAALRLRFNRLAAVGLLILAGCFFAIPATDDRYVAFFQNGRSVTNLSDWPDFVSQSLWPDFTDHMNSARVSPLFGKP